MESLASVLKILLGFLLQFLELLVSFVVSALSLFLDFFRTIVGSV